MGAKSDRRFKAYKLRLEADPTVEKVVSYEDFYVALKDGKAKIDRGYHSDAPSLIRRLYGDKRLKDFKADWIALARHKESMIFCHEAHVKQHGQPTRDELKDLLLKWNVEVILSRALKGAKNSQKAVDSKAFKAPNARTFLSYYDDYLKAGRDIRILLPRHRGPGKNHRLHKVGPESFAFWSKIAFKYADDKKPTKKQLLEECKDAISLENAERTANGRQDLLQSPGRKQFENIINAMDKFHVMAGREGFTKAMAYFRAQSEGFDVERPGERVEFDSYLLELQTWLMLWDLWDKLDEKSKAELKPVRIYLNMARDAYTGYTVAVTASQSENSAAIIHTLDMAIADKSHIARYVGAQTDWYGGVRFESAYADNGTGYNSDDTHDAFRGAHISLSHPPAGQPWHRGFIESMLGVISRTLMSYFDGRTFGNIVEKGDYDSEARATLTADEAVCLIIRALLDYFHHQVNPRTKKTPHEAWVEYLEEIGGQWGADPEMRITVFGADDNRAIHADGIYKWGIRYNSDELQKLRQEKNPKKIKIRFHRDDIRWITVEHPDGHWFLVENRARMKEQISVDEWLHVRRQLNDDAKKAQGPMLPRMYKALRDIRGSVEAARVRACISPSTVTAEQLAILERDLFDGETAMSSDDDVEFDVPVTDIPANPLREGGVVLTRSDRPRTPIKANATKITSRKDKKDDEAGYR